MSVATPTLLARPLIFPHLLPKPPQPHPKPLTNTGHRGHLNDIRDLQREMDDLSDEENEIEDIVRVYPVRSASMSLIHGPPIEHGYPQPRLQLPNSNR